MIHLWVPDGAVDACTTFKWACRFCWKQVSTEDRSVLPEAHHLAAFQLGFQCDLTHWNDAAKVAAETYLAFLSPDQRVRVTKLQSEEPTTVRTDFKCADCGDPLQLQVGRYGRFYGCVSHTVTGCKGGLSAHDDGTPKGWPGNAATRSARGRLVERLSRDPLYTTDHHEPASRGFGFRNRYQTICAIIGRDPKNGLPIAELNQEQCELAIEAIDILAKSPRTRWEHIRLESLLPGD